MPAATGFKRLSLAIVAVIAGAVAALAGASAFIPAERVRSAVIAEIRGVTGLEPAVRGDVAVSLFPTPTVSFAKVLLGDESDGLTALSADRLTATLRLLPLLIGQIETAEVSLTRPRLTVRVQADGQSNWSGLIATLNRALKPDARQPQPGMFSEIRMTDGSIAFVDDTRGITEEVTGAELSLAWPSISRSFGATGRFTWRNEEFDVSLNVADFLAALNGDRSGLKVRLAGTPFKAAFDGHMSSRPTMKVEGTLAADGASLRQALRWSGRQPLPGGGFARFALKAQTTVGGGNFALTGVNIELDGNTAEGVLMVSSDPRVTVKGTLAAEGIDLTPYVSTIELMRGNDRNWNRGPIAIEGLSSFDLDLRLSAARITVANARLGRTGVAANLRDGRLNVTIGEAQAFGGVLRGSLLLAALNAGAEIKSQIQFNDVDLESCLGELFGIRRLEGKGNLSFAVEAAGESVFDLTRTLNGSANLSANQGAISGVNVEQLLKRLEQRPLSGGGDFRRGRTPFERLTVMLKIAQGTATVEDVVLEGGPVRLALGGTASIPARDLNLKGTATLVSSASDAPAFELPFVVQGPWDDPIMLPDAQSLIRRSGAAAPLLDAIRDRKNRDGIRGVIEQLSRDGVVPGGR